MRFLSHPYSVSLWAEAPLSIKRFGATKRGRNDTTWLIAFLQPCGCEEHSAPRLLNAGEQNARRNEIVRSCEVNRAVV